MAKISKTLLFFMCLTVGALMAAGTAVSADYDTDRRGEGNPESTLGAPREMPDAGISAMEVRDLAVKGNAIGFQPLPKDLSDRLDVGAELPANIARIDPPSAILVGLPKHEGYQWVVAGQDLVLVSEDKGVIADVVRGAFQ